MCWRSWRQWVGAGKEDRRTIMVWIDCDTLSPPLVWFLIPLCFLVSGRQRPRDGAGRATIEMTGSRRRGLSMAGMNVFGPCCRVIQEPASRNLRPGRTVLRSGLEPGRSWCERACSRDQVVALRCTRETSVERDTDRSQRNCLCDCGGCAGMKFSKTAESLCEINH